MGVWACARARVRAGPVSSLSVQRVTFQHFNLEFNVDVFTLKWLHFQGDVNTPCTCSHSAWPDFARPGFTAPDWFTTHHALVLLQHGPGLVGTYQVFTLLLFLQAAWGRVKHIAASQHLQRRKVTLIVITRSSVHKLWGSSMLVVTSDETLIVF